MPQTRFAQTVCHFSHNADFDQLRISKYPANAHEINYFSMLVVGDFKHTGRDLFDSVLLFMRYYPAGCFWGMNMSKSRYTQAYIPSFNRNQVDKIIHFATQLFRRNVCAPPDTSKSPLTSYCFSQPPQGTYLIRLKCI